MESMLRLVVKEMTTIANEYTSAGIGANLNIKGLDDLRKANDLFDQISNQSKKLKGNFDLRINIKASGFPQLKQIVSMTDKLRKPIDTKVNISTTDFDKLNKNIAEMNAKVGNLGSDIASRLKKPITDTGNETETATEKARGFRNVLAGGVLGGAIGGAIGGMTSKLKDFTVQSYEAAKGGAGLTKQWKNIGVDDQGTTELMGQVSQIRGMTDMSAGSLNNMQRSFYNLTGNVGRTKELTNAVTAFGKAGGASEDQMQQTSKMASQMLTQRQNQAVNAGMFNKMFGRLPALKSAVQQYSGMSKDAFGSALRDGKITGNQLQEYMSNASKNSGEAWQKFGSSMGGQMSAMKGTFKNAQSAFGKPFFQNVVSAFGTLNQNGKVIGGINGQVTKLAGTFGEKLGGALSKVIGFLSKNMKYISSIGSSIWDITKAVGGGAFDAVKSFFSMFSGGGKNAKSGLQSISDVLKEITKHKTALQNIGKILAGIAGLHFATKGIFALISPFAKLISIVKSVGSAFRFMTLMIASNPIGAIITGITAITVGLIALYKHNKKFRDFVNGMFKSIKKGFSSLVENTKDRFHKIAQFVRDIPKNLKKIGSSIKNTLKDLWDGILDGVKNKMGQLWQWMKDKTSDGINGVIKVINAGIKGIDWVLSKLGGSKQTINPLKEVHLANGTGEQRPINRNTMAMMNDGSDSPQTHNRELAVLPNGKMFMPREKNWRGMLPAGTHVFSAKETRELMASRGIRHFSLGTGVKKAWNWTKDKAMDIGSVLAHPIKYLNNLFHMDKMEGIVGNMFGGMLNKVKSSAKGFLNKFIGQSGNPSGAGVDKWKPIIERASKMMNVGNLNGIDMSKILGSISRESSGNAGARQTVDDVNMRNGNPAQGLLQFIPSTFSKYAVKGHSNIMNGLDQLLAVFNNSNWRSDLHSGNGGWSPTGIPQRAKGGRISANQLSLVGEQGAELFKPDRSGTVIPNNQTKKVMNGGNTSKNITVNSNPKFEIHKNMDEDAIHSLFENYNDSLIDHLNNADI